MSNQKPIFWPGWETVRLIGRGSFGAVYEIQRSIFGNIEKAALKVISIPQNDGDIDELFSEGYDEESITSTFHSHLQSITAEYSLMRKMNGHSNIVSCDDIRYVQHDNGIGWDIFIKMELLTPLTKALPSEIPEKTVLHVAKDMCAALELCKRHGIIHRDVKPQNIFVSDNGDYKLGDFGIAKAVEQTMGGTKIGTYKYMAPEVYNNQPYGTSADIYSLGLVLYWMLNERRLPFLPLPPEKLKASMDETARKRRFSGEPIPAPKNGSKQLKAIVLKACAFDPKDRYSSAEEMLQDLNMLSGAPQDIASPVSQPTPPASNNAPDSGNDKPRQRIYGIVAPMQEPAEKKQPAPVPATSETLPGKSANRVYGNLSPIPAQKPKAEAENPQRMLQQQQEQQRLVQQQKEAQERLAQQQKQAKAQAELEQKQTLTAHQRCSSPAEKPVNRVYGNLSPIPALPKSDPIPTVLQQAKVETVPEDKVGSASAVSKSAKEKSSGKSKGIIIGVIVGVVVIAAILLSLFWGGGGASSGEVTTGSASSYNESTTERSSSTEHPKDREDTEEIPTLKWFFVGNGMPTNYDSWSAKLNEYLEERIGVHLEVECISWGDWGNRSYSIVLRNEEYDLIYADASILRAGEREGAFADLSDLIAQTPGITDLIPEAYLTACKVGGRLYAIPNYQDPSTTNFFVWTKDHVDSYFPDYDAFHELAGLTDGLEAIKKGTGETPLMLDMNGIPSIITNKYDSLGLEDCGIGVSYYDGSAQVVAVYEQDDVMADLKTLSGWFNAHLINSDAAVLVEASNVCSLSIAQGWPSVAKSNWGSARGTEVVPVQFEDSVITTDSVQRSMTCISALSKHQGEALKLLELVNTDSYVRDILAYGEEGVNWEYVEAYGERRVHRLNSEWTFVPYTQGSYFNWTQTDDVEDDSWLEELQTQNRNAIASPALGFVCDTTGISNEIAACSAILDSYKPLLLTGTAEPEATVAEMMGKMRNAGFDTIVIEVQHQLDAFLSKQ